MKDNRTSRTTSGTEDLVDAIGYEELTNLRASLNCMREEDIRNIDPETLSEFTEIDIDNSVPVIERVRSLLQQTKNPYCFKYNGMIVKTSFAGKQTIEDCIASCIFTE